ncbi:ABC transporter permease [Agarivorans sp. TSD2052]|uniref:ABC transporter permease n=1 Tax=Agarivorans sp. TSD2052 TaxID=2937286 RepID=UPI00200DC7E1|nr:ABC transporter permease [Agarivorans sp. TSD2052]UPW20654.1 ABC transporter permease [Agarivorans sp. TSD2052]
MLNYFASSLHLGLIALQLVLVTSAEAGFYQRSPSLILLLLMSFYAVAALLNQLTQLCSSQPNQARYIKPLIPTIFAFMLILAWQSIVEGYAISPVLLPAPSSIFDALINNLPILWADFRQTYLKAVLAGYLLGCASGFLMAQWAVKSAFLRQGLVPLGNFMSAIPIVGIAPIMVMWFGFDWQSKAAVIVVMTFFPMFINTLTGLQSTDALHKDLMHTYAASKSQTFFKSQLPQALPFIFNALKLNSTLALIGAIVAEFFGTPIVGMGFRISTEVGRMNMDMVWATIVVAAVAGSLSYGALALLEKSLLFWHPSFRGNNKH